MNEWKQTAIGLTLFLSTFSKRPLDTPKRMIERRERERKVEGEI